MNVVEKTNKIETKTNKCLYLIFSYKFAYVYVNNKFITQVYILTYRISVHGGNPLGASTSFKPLQSTTFPRQAHSTGHWLSKLSSMPKFDEEHVNDNNRSHIKVTINFLMPDLRFRSKRRTSDAFCEFDIIHIDEFNFLNLLLKNCTHQVHCSIVICKTTKLF